MQRDASRELEWSAIEYHQVNTGGQQNLEGLWMWAIEVGRNIDIGIRAGRTRGSTAVQVGKHRAMLAQRLGCVCNPAVNLIHRPIVSPQDVRRLT